MWIETFGHASLLISDGEQNPILLSDPWLTGSVYWRSWWLENYPDDGTLDRLSRVPYVFFTHEHPDHFHPPSIHKLGKSPTYLCPGLPEPTMQSYLAGNGYRYETLSANVWKAVAPTVSVLSIPLWNDDSVVLIDTPTCLVININDAKPPYPLLTRLAKLRRKLGKRTIVLSSYSPASLVNSFFRDGQRVSLLDKTYFVERVNRLCRALDADMYMAFASQVYYARRDSSWANQYKVKQSDLRTGWKNRAALVGPYSRVDLGTLETSTLPVNKYRAIENVRLKSVKKEEERELETEIGNAEYLLLRQYLRPLRPYLALLFPRGIGFNIGGARFRFMPISARLEVGTDAGAFTFHAPRRPFKEALESGHLTDLCIPMFSTVTLSRHTGPKRVYVFVILMALLDYGHLRTLGGFGRWFRSALPQMLFPKSRGPSSP